MPEDELGLARARAGGNGFFFARRLFLPSSSDIRAFRYGKLVFSASVVFFWIASMVLVAGIMRNLAWLGEG